MHEHSKLTLPTWYVYALKSLTKDFIYVGSTNNLYRRFSEHTAGLVQSTKHYRPFELVAYVAVRTERKARELEKYFKTGSGKAILKKRILSDKVASQAHAILTDEAVFQA